MVAQLVSFGFALLVIVTVIAIGSYVGTLRALETFYGDGGSVFLSDEFDGPRER